MKKIVGVLALVVNALFFGQNALAEPYLPTGFAPSSDRQAIVVQDLPTGPDFTSIISKNQFAGDESESNPRMCQSLTTNGCNLGSEASMNVVTILPFCVENATNCVEGLKVTKSDGTFVDAKFVKQFPGFTFQGIEELDAPSGSTPSLWLAEGAPNGANTEKYVVNVSLEWQYKQRKVRYTGFSARVIPVKDVYGSNFRPSRIMYHINGNTGKFQSNHDNGEQGGLFLCAATETGYCAEKVDFSPKTKAQLSMRLTNQVTGWLHGRISNPEIQISELDATHNRLVVSGEPVEIPTMYAEFEKSKVSREFLNVFEHGWNNIGGFNSRSQWFEYNSSRSEAAYLIQQLGQSVKDTAAGTRTYWTLKSIPSENTGSPCLMDTKRLVGLVNTNAMAYEAQAPTFTNGMLSYKVSGLHFMPDGKTPVEGSYDLAIRSDAARCLYKFSSAPISASISVTGFNGETKIAVTRVYEKDGWLRLTAQGFTFSSPTISIKLTQASSKKTSITCTKGKLLKKVTAVKPKCPAGYKKK